MGRAAADTSSPHAARCLARFAAACSALEVKPHLMTKWWKKISDAYSAPERAYHTLEHIDEMLQLAKKYADDLEDRVAVDLAIVFHDVVYDAWLGGKGCNERQSGWEFIKFAEECTTRKTFTGTRRDKIQRWIERTYTHKPEPLDDDDCKLFLDFDMAILAADRDRYLRYAAGVRVEYAHVNWVSWRVGRSRFLAGSTDAKVFGTAKFAPREAAARENALAECAQLRRELRAFYAAAAAAAAALGAAGLAWYWS